MSGKDSDYMDSALRHELEAQVKRLTEELKQVRAVAYNYADFTPTCREDGKCFICDEYLHGESHADDCLATLFRRVVKDGDEASMVWLEMLDAKEQVQEKLVEVLATLKETQGLAAEALKWVGKTEDWAYALGSVDLHEGIYSYLADIDRRLDAAPADIKGGEKGKATR